MVAVAVGKSGPTVGSVDGPVADGREDAARVVAVPQAAVGTATASVTTATSQSRRRRVRGRVGDAVRGGAPAVVQVRAMRQVCPAVARVGVTTVGCGSRPPPTVTAPWAVTAPWNNDAVPATSTSTSTGLIDVIRRFGEQLAPLLVDLDPATLHPSDAAALVSDVVAVERRLAGLRLACAARATESGAVAASGSRSAEHWYAEQAGVGLPTARRSLQTSRRLQDLQRIREQAMAGALSEVQVDRVADAASANPRSEGALLQAAERSGLRGLAAVCDRAKAEVRDEHAEEQRLAAVHRRRFLRHSRTADGAFRLEVHTTPDAGARVMAAIDRRAGALFHVARRQGRREPHHAYQVDALVELVAGAVTGARSSEPAHPADGTNAADERGPATGQQARATVPVASITFLVDAEAFRRGCLGPGERCELAGVGSVPLSMVERYVGASRVDLVVSRGVDVASVVSLGRAIPRTLRLALQVRDATCVVPGCDVSSPLEIDHIVPFARGGPTRLSNLCRLCSHHHDLKTYRGWTIRGSPGAWQWRRPDDLAHPDVPAEGSGAATPPSLDRAEASDIGPRGASRPRRPEPSSPSSPGVGSGAHRLLAPPLFDSA